MAATLTGAQKRRRDALRIESIIERADRRIAIIFDETPNLWCAWRKKKGRIVSHCLNSAAKTISRPLERALDAAQKIAESCSA